jgi:hypothetical protein
MQQTKVQKKATRSAILSAGKKIESSIIGTGYRINTALYSLKFPKHLDI